ncbi:MAG: phage major tail tube protein [Clostridium sp.]|nr:phage major tail tube protein [Clostridium sp.]
MGKSSSEGLIPEVINNFNVYNGDAKKMLGISEEIQLPEFTAITSEIKGAGILGAYSAAILGHYEDTDIEIPYKAISQDMMQFTPGKYHTVTFRANMQSTVQKTREKANRGIKIVVGGVVKGFKPGSLKIGDQMSSSITLNVTYFKYEQDGFTIFELDKINPKLVVNDNDLLSDILNNC